MKNYRAVSIKADEAYLKQLYLYAKATDTTVGELVRSAVDQAHGKKVASFFASLVASMQYSNEQSNENVSIEGSQTK